MNNSICKKGIYNTFQNDYLIGFNIKDIWKNTNIYDCINIKKKNINDLQKCQKWNKM